MLLDAYRALSASLELLPGRWRGAAPAARTDPARALLHGASAGEVRAATALREVLADGGSPNPWPISTGSVAGLSMGADFQLPRDLPRRVAAVYEALQPAALVLIEAELWPNLLNEATRRSVPVGVAGARISPTSWQRYRSHRRLSAQLLDKVSAFAAASPADAERICSLGVQAHKVEVCGWLKWPKPAAESCTDHEQSAPPWRAQKQVPQPLLVLGSIYPGEASRLHARLRETTLRCGPSRWLLVPRKSQHIAAIRREAARHLPAGSWSVEQRFGVLQQHYKLADAIFVGGGWAGRSCHDVLEALAAGSRAMCASHTGDPGGKIDRLAKHHLVIDLDRDLELRGKALEQLALAGVDGAYEELRKEMDGRTRTIRFFQQQGLIL